MRRCLVLFALLALVLLALASSASGAPRLYAAEYSEDLIGGFDVAADGSLTPIAGSPFKVGGSTVGGTIGFGFTPEGSRAAVRYLFKQTAQGLSVSAGGAMAPAGATVLGATAEGLAVSPDGRFAYAGTRTFGGFTAEGIRYLSIGAGGSLTPIGATAGAGEYGEIAMTPDGRFLFAYSAGGIKRFAVNPDGSLNSLGTTNPGIAARYLTVSPNGRFLFLGDDGGKGGVASFTIGADGSLTQNGEPALTGGTSVELFAVSPDGAYIYMPDEGQNKIVVAAVALDGALTVVGSMPTPDPEVAAVSPDGRFLYWFHGGSTEAISVASIGAGGIPTPLPFETPWQMGEPVRLEFQPGPVPVASFTAKAAVPGTAARFNASKSTGAAVYDWDFGDGTILTNGGPSPQHAYGGAGKYAVTLSLTDASGCGAAQIYTGQSTTCPGGTAATKTLTVDTLPVLSRLGVSNKKFVPKGSAGAGKRGTTFRFRLNEVAKVSIKIERKLAGRKVGGKCKGETPANSGRKKCPLFRRLGSRSLSGKAGANKLKFNGKLKGLPLAPGGYRATAIATDSAKGQSVPRRVRFRVLGG